eukprot:g15442.t1
MWAAHLGHSAVCQLLLKSGADASIKNASGQTAENHVSFSAGIEADPAAARRAANLAAVQAALREQAERKEEEEFWSNVRARRERRDSEGDKDDFRQFAASTAHRYAKQEWALIQVWSDLKPRVLVKMPKAQNSSQKVQGCNPLSI